MLVVERSDFFLKECLRMILELHIFFGPCHVTFPYKENLSFFVHCHVTLQYMGPLSSLGRFVQKVIASCFYDSFVLKKTQESDGSCNFTSDYQLLYILFKN